jgi:cytosine/adenosine deaminase-related metal-dependent hydrolase
MLIVNAKIINLNKLDKRDAIYIKDGVIEDIGNSSEFLKYYSREEVLDAEGRTVFPGLVNAHMHGYGILGSYFLDKNFNWNDVFNKLKEMQFQKEDTELVYYSAIMAGIFAIRSGVTTVFDICHGNSSTSEMISEAYNVLGLRGVVYQFLDKNNFGFLKNYRSKRSGNLFLGITISSKKDYLPIIKKLSADDRILIHEDQVSGEEENLLNQLMERELMNKSTIFVHGTYSENSLEAMTKRNINLVSCPLVDELLDTSDSLTGEGINLCMGSGMLNVDMFVAAKEAFKHSTLSIKEIDSIIENNNNELVYRVLGEKVGKIEKGYKADLFVSKSTPIIDEAAYSFVYRSNFWVEDVIIDGKLVLKNREILGVKEEEVYESIKEYLSRS